MTILVTGATGNIGRQVVDELIALGANDIRALTVNPAKAALPDSVTAVTGYLGKPDSLPAALDGVERVYLAPHPPTLAATLEHLTDAGVRYVVALTGGAHWQQHADAVTASGLGQTQLGPGEFSDNFTMWAPRSRRVWCTTSHPMRCSLRCPCAISPGWPLICSPIRRTPTWARCTS